MAVHLALQLAVLAPLTCALVVSVAWAATVVVSQENRSFGVKEVTVAVGDSVVFQNDDYYGHNVYSDDAGFDIGLQEPGESRTVEFDAAGRFMVRCRIHPKMRMKVVVEG